MTSKKMNGTNRAVLKYLAGNSNYNCRKFAQDGERLMIADTMLMDVSTFATSAKSS